MHTLLGKKELAQHLGVYVHTVSAWVSKRAVPHIKLGRRVLFSPEAIERWIKEHTVAT